MVTRIAMAAVLIAATVVLIEFSPPAVFTAAATVLALVTLREWSAMLKSYGLRIFPVTYLLTAAVPGVWLLFPSEIASLVILATLLTLVWSVGDATEVPRKLLAASANLASVFYLGFPFGILAAYQREHDPRIWLILLVVWSGDSAALFVGKAWGRRRLTPNLSPNKTAEGFAAAAAGSVLAGIAAGYLVGVPSGPLYLGTAGLVIGIAAIFGDLFESAVKRGIRLKDSSDLIPGHGGVLDRLDSLLLALPAFFLLDRLLQ